MRQFVCQVAVYALAAPAIAIVLAVLANTPADRLPQVVKGGDALSVAFADAKATIAAAMVQKADRYFHGGIDIDCHCSDECHDDEHGHSCAHEHEHGHEQAEAGDGLFDPWQWINRHVRAPERHIHLDGEKAVETLPWFWAAVRADPHNVDAWTSAAYAADRMMRDKALARRVIAEAREKNPDSMEVALMEARIAYDGGAGDLAEAARLFERARMLGERKCGGRLSELSARDAATYRMVVNYLSRIRASRGDDTSACHASP